MTLSALIALSGPATSRKGAPGNAGGRASLGTLPARPKGGASLGQSRAYPSGRPMRISFVYSTGRMDSGVVRRPEGNRQNLVVMCSWGQAPVETLLRIHNDLAPEEKAEMLAALGLPRANGA